MSSKFYDADQYINKYIEVIIFDYEGEEHIYWVSLESVDPEDDDSVFEKALSAHIKRGFPEVDISCAEFLEPFSRYESEFTFVT